MTELLGGRFLDLTWDSGLGLASDAGQVWFVESADTILTRLFNSAEVTFLSSCSGVESEIPEVSSCISSSATEALRDEVSNASIRRRSSIL